MVYRALFQELHSPTHIPLHMSLHSLLGNLTSSHHLNTIVLMQFSNSRQYKLGKGKKERKKKERHTFGEWLA